MSALDLAALKALHEEAEPGAWESRRRRLYNSDGATLAEGLTPRDAAFIVAAHTHWLELLAMAEAFADCERRIAVMSALVDYWKKMAVDLGTAAAAANAEKAAMAERLDSATSFEMNGHTASRRAWGNREWEVSRTWDGDSPRPAPLVFSTRDEALAAIAAHEAERGKA